MKILSVKKVYKGFLTILNLTVETSKREVVQREVMARSGGKKSDDAVAALVFDTVKRKFIFAKQFRAGLMNEDDQSLRQPGPNADSRPHHQRLPRLLHRHTGTHGVRDGKDHQQGNPSVPPRHTGAGKHTQERTLTEPR